MGGSAVSASTGLLERSRPGEQQGPRSSREPTPPGGNGRAAVLTGAPGDTASPSPARHDRSRARATSPRPRGRAHGRALASKAFPPTHTGAMRHQGRGWQQNDRPPQGRPAPCRGSPPRPPRRNSLSFQPLTSETPTGRGRPDMRQRPQRQCREEERQHAGSASGTSNDNPDRSRSTTEDQGRGALARHGGAAAALPKAEGGPHTRGPATDRGWQARSIRCVSRPQGGVGAGFRTPAFHTPPRDVEERREARGQDEKSGPVRHERPSLAWRGFGPAQESARSPHRSVDRREGDPGSGGPGEDHRQHGACFGLAGPTPQGERQTTQTGERLTRGTEPWKRASSQTALGARGRERTVVKDLRHIPRRPRVPETGGGTAAETLQMPKSRRAGPGGRLKREGAWATPSSSVAQSPHTHPEVPTPSATHAKGQRVSTHPTAQNGHLGTKQS